MSKKYTGLSYLLQLNEADTDPMPDADFSDEMAPPQEEPAADPGLDPVDDLGPTDDLGGVEDTSVEDLPQINLSNTDKATLCLVFSLAGSTAKARQAIESKPNAVESAKQMVAHGLLKVEMSNYEMTDKGIAMMKQFNLISPDDDMRLSSEGSHIAAQYFY